jgi:glycosyltransferase 2 family protein
VGILLAAAAIFYLVRTLSRSLEQTSLSDLLSFDPLLLVLSFLLLQVHLVAAAWSWKRATRVAGASITMKQAYSIHFVALVGKYIPGKVWAVVGKVGLSRRIGVPASVSGQALVFESVLIVSGSLLMSLPLLPRLSRQTHIDAVLCLVGVAAVIALLLVAAHTSNYRRLLDLIGRVTGRSFTCSDSSFPAILKLLPIYLLVFALMGLSFVMLAWSFGVPLPLFPGIAVFPTAAAIGFIVLLAPGGLGVSEFSVAWLMSMICPGADAGQLALLALASRLWLTLGELVSFSLAVSFWGGRKAVLRGMGEARSEDGALQAPDSSDAEGMSTEGSQSVSTL